MPFSSQLADAARSVVRSCAHPFVQSDTEADDVAVDPTFEADGFAGSEVIAIKVRLRNGQVVRVIAKRWSPFEWLRQLSGLSVWAELLLHEAGTFERIISASGLRVPVIGSCRLGDGDWILMHDVSEHLQTWRNATEDEPRYFWRPTAASLELYAGLVDRLAKMHATFDQSPGEFLADRFVHALRSHERCVRGSEALLKEWFADPEGDEKPAGTSEVPEKLGTTPWASRATIAADRRRHYRDFLDRLSASNRSVWLRSMVNRDSLVAIARQLPRTLLHADLNRRNIGVGENGTEREYVLIDWEAAAYANHAFDLVSLIGGKVFTMEERGSLERYYLDRYRHYGGQALNDATWMLSLDLATAVEGLDRLPHNGEIVRRSGSAEYIERVEAKTELVTRCLERLNAESESA